MARRGLMRIWTPWASAGHWNAMFVCYWSAASAEQLVCKHELHEPPPSAPQAVFMNSTSHTAGLAKFRNGWSSFCLLQSAYK